jgi:outer membrane protein OmpA-like peptidoglycan-associated protein
MRHFIIALLTISLGITGCQSAGKKTAVGAGVGVAAGALAGAVIGHQSGNRDKGAAIGAILGGTAGGVIGNRMDRQAKELEQIAETRRTDEGLITKFKGDILFDTGKYNLKASALNNISQMASIIKKYPENVLTIRGYTDNTGTPNGNKTLSEMRATSVREELIKGGVPSSTITVIGMGRDNPIADNKSAQGRSHNRRVEIEITVDESKVPKK